jgi:hypothetical protein
MVRSAEKRISTYGIRQKPADIKAKLEDLRIPPEYVVGFMKIGMYIYGLKNKHSGEMLKVEAQAYINAQATKLYGFIKDGAKAKSYLEWVLAYFGLTGVTVPNPPAS